MNESQRTSSFIRSPVMVKKWIHRKKLLNPKIQCFLHHAIGTWSSWRKPHQQPHRIASSFHSCPQPGHKWMNQLTENSHDDDSNNDTMTWQMINKTHSSNVVLSSVMYSHRRMGADRSTFSSRLESVELLVLRPFDWTVVCRFRTRLLYNPIPIFRDRTIRPKN